MINVDEVLDLWFGPITADGVCAQDRSDLWWKKNPDTDAMLRQRFGRHVERAIAGEIDGETTTAQSRLAAILYLDQLTRNIYRDTLRAFAGDVRARSLCLEGLDLEHDTQLPLIQRVFFYLPLEHAEDRALQRRSCKLFAALLEAAPAAHKQTFAAYLDYAERHRAIIERFGRFPHRNTVLGRSSNAEEAAFLEEPGSSF